MRLEILPHFIIRGGDCLSGMDLNIGANRRYYVQFVIKFRNPKLKFLKSSLRGKGYFLTIGWFELCLGYKKI